MAKKNKLQKFYAYKHVNLNLYLSVLSLGEGENELKFVKELTPECIFSTDWYHDDSMDKEVTEMLQEEGVELNDKWMECHFDDFKKIAVQIIEVI